MAKRINIRSVFVSFLTLTTLFALPTLIFASDTLTITTYYPSPYGVYREMRSQRMAIGDDYIDNTAYCWEGDCTNTIHPDADLVVEGNVGIGTTRPGGPLQVNVPTGWYADDGSKPTEILSYAGITYGRQYIGSGWQYNIDNPTSGAKLQLTGMGGGNILLFAGGTNQSITLTPSGTGYTILNGNVGIGNATPSYLLTVGSASNTSKAVFQNTDNNHGTIQIGNPNSNDEASICFISGARGFGDAPSSVNGSDHIWGMGPGVWGIGGNKFGIGNDYGSTRFTIDSGGNTWIAGTLTQGSDIRNKDKISPLENSLGKMNKLRGVTFYWKDKATRGDRRQIGLIAQEVEKEFPELVTTDKEGYKSVAYGNLTAVLLEAIKAQQNQIDELKQEISQLKASKS